MCPSASITGALAAAMPDRSASCSATASQRSKGYSSCSFGNFAIDSAPSASTTDALGRAPPSEEPGANRSRRSSSDSVIRSVRSLASSNRRTRRWAPHLAQAPRSARRPPTETAGHRSVPRPPHRGGSRAPEGCGLGVPLGGPRAARPAAARCDPTCPAPSRRSHRRPPAENVAPFERQEDLDGRHVALHGDPSRGRRARSGVAASDRACPTSSRRGSATTSRSPSSPSAWSTEA